MASGATTAATHSISGAPDRFEWLLRSQNGDGGWSWRAGRRSWVEPSVYALLAIQSAGASSKEAKRGSEYLLKLQNPDGSWPASAMTPGSHWVTSLCVAAGIRTGWPDAPVRNAVTWLLAQYGSEGRLLARLGRYLDPHAVEYDPRWRGWAWTPGTSSWIEPTSHALRALAAARQFGPVSEIDARLESARRLLIDRRCSDGGWNYGNSRVRGADLPGYPQTTALALLALRGESAALLQVSISRAAAMYRDCAPASLGSVWLAHALRAHGIRVEYRPPSSRTEVLPAALDVLAIAGVEPA